jgi:ketosteroid isomerase-like protein
MSDKNKEIVKKINDSFTAGNTDGFLEHCADNIVWNMVGDKETRGKTAIKKWMSQMEGMEPPKFTVDKIISEGDSVILLRRYDHERRGRQGREIFVCRRLPVQR